MHQPTKSQLSDAKARVIYLPAVMERVGSDAARAVPHPILAVFLLAECHRVLTHGTVKDSATIGNRRGHPALRLAWKASSVGSEAEMSTFPWSRCLLPSISGSEGWKRVVLISACIPILKSPVQSPSHCPRRFFHRRRGQIERSREFENRLKT
jgi:hypothetical protein